MASPLFEERERAVELQKAKEQEAQFRRETQATRLLARWAAGQMGLAEAAIESYVEAISEIYLKQKGRADVLARVAADLIGSQIQMTLHHLENQFDLHLAEAQHQGM